MALLEVLGRMSDGCRLTNLAREAGLSLTTVHRILTTLEQRHFVQFSAADNLWHIGHGAFAVGSAFTREKNFVATATPFLRRLRDQTRETANLGVAENGEVLLVDQVRSREIERAASHVGGRTPMVASGMGKAMLSQLSADAVELVVQRHGMYRVTARTLTSRHQLQRQLATVSSLGYAIDDEEYRVGLRCVASPVFNAHGEVVCAISVSGSTARLTDGRLSLIGDLVSKAATELSRVFVGSAFSNSSSLIPLR